MRHTQAYHAVDEGQTPARPEEEPAVPRSLSRIFRHWWAELLAAVLFTFDFSVLVAVLRAYQGEPLPKWPLGFSFNAALSVIVLIFRAPVLFIAAEGIGQLKWQWLLTPRPLSDLALYDSATRGPWGSSKLLWVVKWRDGLAFLAALLTVASFGIDSFTQAVVSYYPCTSPATSALATISHINSFFSDGTFGYMIPTRVSRAIDMSFDNPTTLLSNYSCSADSCIFAHLYHSVGLCSRCFNVTDHILTDCTEDRSSCNYTLTQQRSNSGLYPAGNTTTGYTSDDGVSGDSFTQRWHVFSIRKYFVEEPADSYYSSTVDIVSATPLVGCRCQIFYCIRSHTATIDHGVLHETLQSTSKNWSSFTKETRVISTVRVDCLEPRVQQYLLDEGYVSADTQWMSWNGTYLGRTEAQDGISDSSNLTLPVNCVYQMYFDWSIGKSKSESDRRWTPFEWFTSVLNDTTLNTVSVTGPQGRGPMNMQNPSMGNLVGLYDRGKVSMESLNHAFENFTTVVSNYMRTLRSPGTQGGVMGSIAIPRSLNLSSHSYPEDVPLPPIEILNPVSASTEDWNKPITGQPFVYTTCIHVRWPWLALPAAIFVSTLFLLVMLVVKTTWDYELEVWKSSRSALIWHGLDGSAEFESDALVTAKDMDNRAKEIYVRLEKTRMSWKLVQNEQ